MILFSLQKIMKGLDQNDSEVTDETLTVIESSDTAKYPAITSITGSGEQAVVVRSMVPVR